MWGVWEKKLGYRVVEYAVDDDLMGVGVRDDLMGVGVKDDLMGFVLWR
jgi:hypothetical protein